MMMLPITIILLIMLVLLAPGLLIVVGVGALMFIPVYLMFSSVLTLVMAPQQILTVSTNRRVRRNHSCEHATVNVLEQEFGPLPHVSGIAVRDGFYLWGAEPFHPNLLLRAAQTALDRMQHGEHHLAIHPRCGTSLLMARFVFALAFLALLVAAGYFTLTGFLLAILLAWAFGRPVGQFVQRHFTTAPDVDGLAVTTIQWTDHPRVPGMPPFATNRGAYFFHVAH